MHLETGIVALKPFLIAMGVGSIAMVDFFAQTDVGKTFEAIGIYGLPTVLVVYFIARDWYREAIADKRKEAQEAQAIRDREELVKVTEAREARSHEVRLNRERELVQQLAAERQRNHELTIHRHEDHTALMDLIRTGKIHIDNVPSISDSSTGHFLPKQGDKR